MPEASAQVISWLLLSRLIANLPTRKSTEEAMAIHRANGTIQRGFQGLRQWQLVTIKEKSTSDAL